MQLNVVDALAKLPPVAYINSYFQAVFFRLIDRRITPKAGHRLTHRSVFIFPTLRGCMFIGLILLLWLLGTNYQNNLVLALAFLLVSLFIVTILHTYANLSGLSINYKSASAVFAGEEAEFIFALTVNKGAAENLQFRWQDSNYLVQKIDVGNNQITLVSVPKRTLKRGWLKPGRLLVQSEFPLGLLRCWSWLNWEAAAVVYPLPAVVAEPKSIAADEEGDEEHPIKGGEDYNQLANYRPGDPINHVAWKQFARGKGLYIKEFSHTVSREIWLDFNGVSVNGQEAKLSGLCYWALEYELRDEYYGLRLPGVIVAPGRGENHKLKVLRALALYGLPPSSSGLSH